MTGSRQILAAEYKAGRQQTEGGCKMEIIVRAWEERDIPDMVRIWNEVVEEGIAFPQEEL